MKNIFIALVLLLNGVAAYAQKPAFKASVRDSINLMKPPMSMKFDSGKKTAAYKDNNNLIRKDTNTYKTYKPNDAPDSLYRHLPDAKEGQPLYIVNSNIISGLGHINPNDISSLTILKGKDVPANLLNLSRFGVLFVTLKKETKFETSTFNDIKKRFNIEDKVRYAVDGYFVDDENLLVSTQDIDEINVIWKRNSDLSSEVTINIWLLAPEARKGIIYKADPNNKPGTIRIRGLASK